MTIDAKEFESIHIDFEKGIHLLNGEAMPRVSYLELRFDNGNWSLFISRDEFYKKPVTKDILKK